MRNQVRWAEDAFMAKGKRATELSITLALNVVLFLSSSAHAGHANTHTHSHKTTNKRFYSIIIDHIFFIIAYMAFEMTVRWQNDTVPVLWFCYKHVILLWKSCQQRSNRMRFSSLPLFSVYIYFYFMVS